MPIRSSAHLCGRMHKDYMRKVLLQPEARTRVRIFSQRLKFEKIFYVCICTERCNVFVVFTVADKSGGNSEFFSDRNCHAAFCGRIVFCQYESVYPDSFFKYFCLPERILTCCRIDHQNTTVTSFISFLCACPVYFRKLLHKIFLIMQTSCSVGKNETAVL